MQEYQLGTFRVRNFEKQQPLNSVTVSKCQFDTVKVRQQLLDWNSFHNLVKFYWNFSPSDPYGIHTMDPTQQSIKWSGLMSLDKPKIAQSGQIKMVNCN